MVAPEYSGFIWPDSIAGDRLKDLVADFLDG